MNEEYLNNENIHWHKVTKNMNVRINETVTMDTLQLKLPTSI